MVRRWIYLIVTRNERWLLSEIKRHIVCSRVCYSVLCFVVFFIYFPDLTGGLFEVREESQWRSTNQLGQGWPTVREITGINTQQAAVNNKTSLSRVSLYTSMCSVVDVSWCEFLIRRRLRASGWALRWLFELWETPHIEFFLFDKSFGHTTRLHDHNIWSYTRRYFKMILFELPFKHVLHSFLPLSHLQSQTFRNRDD